MAGTRGPQFLWLQVAFPCCWFSTLRYEYRLACIVSFLAEISDLKNDTHIFFKTESSMEGDALCLHKFHSLVVVRSVGVPVLHSVRTVREGSGDTALPWWDMVYLARASLIFTPE